MEFQWCKHPKISLNSFVCVENKKTGIEEAIETEKLKQALVEDENSIKKYFEMYAKADFDDEDTRNQVLEYFVDKIYVYNDRLVITWYYSDDKTSIDLDALTEITETSESNTVDRGSTLLRQVHILFCHMYCHSTICHCCYYLTK